MPFFHRQSSLSDIVLRETQWPAKNAVYALAQGSKRMTVKILPHNSKYARTFYTKIRKIIKIKKRLKNSGEIAIFRTIKLLIYMYFIYSC
jgi:hypothetical protein